MASAFLDPEMLLVGANQDGILSPYGTVGTFTPVDVADHLPFITVRVGGGPRDQREWRPRMDIQVFGPNRPTCREVIESVDDFLTKPLGIWQFDEVICNSGPQEVHWADDKCRLWVAEYQLVIRRS